MVYQKGRVFHTQCFITHGSSFPTPDNDFTILNARTRIDLVQLKNLKARREQEQLTSRPAETPKISKSKKKTIRKKKPKKIKLRKSKPKKIERKKTKKRR
jgi:hypothetical protein